MSVGDEDGLSFYNSSIASYSSGSTQTIDISATGNVKFGSNVGSPSTTAFEVVATGGNAGDVRLGIASGQNALWDQSAGTLVVTGQIVVQSGSSGIATFGDAGGLATKSSVDLSTNEVTNKTLDELADGTYSKIAETTVIAGGYIRIGSGTKVADTLSGWQLDRAGIWGEKSDVAHCSLTLHGPI